MKYDELAHELYFVASGVKSERYKSLLTRAADAIKELSKPGWIKFKTRPLTEEEREEHPEWVYIMDCELPDDGQEILVSNGRYVWMDTFCNDADGCYLDGDSELEELWWQPRPEPPEVKE